jgi:hypothetical protein
MQTFGLSLRGIENAIAAPISTFSYSFNTLHKVLLLTLLLQRLSSALLKEGMRYTPQIQFS